ncbi:MAG TPA: tetratricopeptide repeat protein [Pyrinomonadaceae bacterium]|nr:tetratricopeptide repeat protein [Pyrinomonadaceae bacterium]
MLVREFVISVTLLKPTRLLPLLLLAAAPSFASANSTWAQGEPITSAEVAATVERLREGNVDAPTVEAALVTGQTLLRARRYGEAVDVFNSVLALRPQEPRALYGAALALFNLRRPAEAEPLAKAAADHLLREVSTRKVGATSTQRISAADALVLQAVIQAVRGRDQAALKSSELAVKVSPEHFDAQFTYGRALFSVGDTAEAAKVFRRAVTLKPSDTQALFFLGTTLEKTGDVAGAIKTYRQIIANTPQAAEGHLGVGILLVRRSGSDGEEGIRELERALAIDGSLYEARVALGRALLTRGRLAESVDHLVRAAELMPGNPEPHYQLSLAYRRLGLTDKAEQETAAVRRIHEARRGTTIQSKTQSVPKR